MDERETCFRALLAYAEQDDDVLALFVFGSRGRDDGMADARSDYDVAVVLKEGLDVLRTFDERWPYVHGAAVEVARSTLSELREHGEYGTATACARSQYAHVRLLVDKTDGDVRAVLAEKQRIPTGVRERVVREALDAYVNSTYRSLRYGMVGARGGARLDAAESIPHLLTAVFAMAGRVRPFNKYLAAELRRQPLGDGAWAADAFPERLMAVLAGDVDEQRALFGAVEETAREQGFGDVIAAWEPGVALLRGDAEYRV